MCQGMPEQGDFSEEDKYCLVWIGLFRGTSTLFSACPQNANIILRIEQCFEFACLHVFDKRTMSLIIC